MIFTPSPFMAKGAGGEGENLCRHGDAPGVTHLTPRTGNIERQLAAERLNYSKEVPLSCQCL
jgi:hypothetical protein